MKVRMKNRWKKLGDLEPGQRFRRQRDTQNLLWQVSGDKASAANCLQCHRDDTGESCGWPQEALVEHVKGSWIPEEDAEGLKEIGNVEFLTVVEYDGEFWQITCEGNDGECVLRQVENYEKRSLPPDTLVRLVHCKLVEDGAVEEVK